MAAAVGKFDMNNIAILDRQVGQLLDCKPLSENEVKELCDKVFYPPQSISSFLYSFIKFLMNFSTTSPDLNNFG
jgi:hypothetical protein